MGFWAAGRLLQGVQPPEMAVPRWSSPPLLRATPAEGWQAPPESLPPWWVLIQKPHWRGSLLASPSWTLRGEEDEACHYKPVTED